LQARGSGKRERQPLFLGLDRGTYDAGERIRSLAQPLPTRSLKTKIFAQQQIAMLPVNFPLFYLLGAIYQLDDRQIMDLVVKLAPVLVLLFGMVIPLWLIHVLTERALRDPPGEAPGERLRRILVLPRLLEVLVLLMYLLAVLFPTGYICWAHGRSPLLIIPSMLVTLVMNLLGGVRQTMVVEELLRPLAIEEFERHPGVRPAGSGFLWPRQVWYFPYILSLVLLASFVSLGVILASRFPALLGPRSALRLAGRVSGDQVSGEIVLPLVVILGYVLVLGAVTALTVARRLRSGSRAVEQAVLALASGAPVLPRWPATDELGDLAFATAGALHGLREKALAIASSARTVDEVAHELSALVTRHRQVVVTQAGALRQSQQTAQEIKGTSDLASERARSVLSSSEQAEQVGKSSRDAVRSNLEQIGLLHAHASEMAGQMTQLKERAQQIGRITLTVKDLADQSNMVALNAAIEATRAGENGKVFATVAQQIRRLADGSNAAIEQVREVLHDVETAVHQAVNLSKSGLSRAASSIKLAAEHGENLQRLTDIVVSNASSARQISAAVTQQAAGISQIFAALTSLEATMSQSADAMVATETASARAERAALEVGGVMAGYEWRRSPGP